MDYQLLAWDTDFFGIKTGKIIPISLDEDQLASIITLMRKEGYHLVYWAADQQCE